MRLIERPFSDLLRKPKEVTDDVEQGDVLLRRGTSQTFGSVALTVRHSGYTRSRRSVARFATSLSTARRPWLMHSPMPFPGSSSFRRVIDASSLTSSRGSLQQQRPLMTMRH